MAELILEQVPLLIWILKVKLDADFDFCVDRNATDMNDICDLKVGHRPSQDKTRVSRPFHLTVIDKGYLLHDYFLARLEHVVIRVCQIKHFIA